MLVEKLKYIFEQFQHDGEFQSFEELASGHINDTYLIKTNKKPHFVLQRINHGVFNDVPGLIENKVGISHHIQEKLKNLPKSQQSGHVLSFVETKTDDYYYFQDDDENYWNLMYFIDKSQTFENVKSEEIAYEAGRLLGQFLAMTNDFEVSKLIEVIPNFHNMSFRYLQFETALLNAPKERKHKAKVYIDKIKLLKEEMHMLQNLKDAGKLKIRVTHNDAKVSNILFNNHNKGLCIIDTDTAMPGIIHYDFGDAVRTICTTAKEDERNLDLVTFNTSYYKVFTRGFLMEMKSSLSPFELDLLPIGAKTMIFIMALRFLTDYLNRDVYYKIKYPEHNLDRAKNQFKLLESISQQITELEKYEMR